MKNESNAQRIKDLEQSIKSEEANLDRMQELDSSDCFRSVHASRLNIDLMKTKIRILENDGFAYFPVLTDLEGNIISERIVNGKYGKCFIIENEDGSVNFVNHNVREKTLEKKGFRLDDKPFRAWAVIDDDHITVFKTEKGEK